MTLFTMASSSTSTDRVFRLILARKEDSLLQPDQEHSSPYHPEESEEGLKRNEDNYNQSQS